MLRLYSVCAYIWNPVLPKNSNFYTVSEYKHICACIRVNKVIVMAPEKLLLLLRPEPQRILFAPAEARSWPELKMAKI